LRRDTRSVEVTVGTAPQGWQPLAVAVADGPTYPGWWRRYGSFVLTVVTAQTARAPAVLDAAAERQLSTAEPTHGWLASPLTARR
jgi:4'-phosphopantetheinyl transferase